MKQPKPNWRKKYEEEAGRLKLCRDGNELIKLNAEELRSKLLVAEKERDAYISDRDVYYGNWQRAKREFEERPTIEKIVEKEVLPFWYGLIIWTVAGLVLAIVVDSWNDIHKLQQPILSPYPVYVARAEIESVLQENLNHEKELVGICQDAWRKDEREIRKLRKELQ